MTDKAAPVAALPTDDELPELEAADTTVDATMAQRATNAGKGPKKYAKVMARMGLKPEPNVTRVQIKKNAAMSFMIARPECYRWPGTNTFVIFGETQVEEGAENAQKAAARTVTGAAPAEGAAAKAAAAADEADDTTVEQGDLQDKEIEIVMSQASVSRGKAIKALKNNNGDIVNAIMELTM